MLVPDRPSCIWVKSHLSGSPVHLSAAPMQEINRQLPPRLGEHTEEVSWLRPVQKQLADRGRRDERLPIRQSQITQPVITIDRP